jgi:hypothetical protein
MNSSVQDVQEGSNSTKVAADQKEKVQKKDLVESTVVNKVKVTLEESKGEDLKEQPKPATAPKEVIEDQAQSTDDEDEDEIHHTFTFYLLFYQRGQQNDVFFSEAQTSRRRNARRGFDAVFREHGRYLREDLYVIIDEVPRTALKRIFGLEEGQGGKNVLLNPNNRDFVQMRRILSANNITQIQIP